MEGGIYIYMQRYKDRYDYRIQIVVHQSCILGEVQDHSCRSTTAHSKRSQEKDIYFKVRKPAVAGNQSDAI